MAEWTLMNPPANRSKDNTRPGIYVGAAPPPEEPMLSPEEAAKKNLESQPPLFLLLTRASPTTVTLSNAITRNVIYTVRDTGRGSLSTKPDFEVFRHPGGGHGEMFAGSIRFGRRTLEVKLPLTGKKLSDVENVEITKLGGMKWHTTKIGYKERNSNAGVENGDGPKWVAILDCYGSDSAPDEPMCSVKLYDGLPNGRIEIWPREACVDVGGEWNILDEMVTIAYANMEVARKKIMRGPDPSGIGIAGIGMV